jgi:hypothetical protein
VVRAKAGVHGGNGVDAQAVSSSTAIMSAAAPAMWPVTVVGSAPGKAAFKRVVMVVVLKGQWGATQHAQGGLTSGVCQYGQYGQYGC